MGCRVIVDVKPDGNKALRWFKLNFGAHGYIEMHYSTGGCYFIDYLGPVRTLGL
jgi:hypothetical protein